MRINAVHFILYVKDQQVATEFYSRILAREPRLNVPGMTEFEIDASTIIGLMPYTSVANLFGNDKAAQEDQMVLKTELYLIVDDPKLFHSRAIEAGASELSPFAERDWGHAAAYSVDMDGNVIAFARAITEEA